MNKALVESTKLLDDRGRILLDRICVQLGGEAGQRVVFTGASRQVGTSFIALHVAQTIAGYGKRVLLIDADLRKDTQREEYTFLGSDRCHGLKQYYAGLCEIEDMIYETNVNNLSLIPAGGMVSRPVTLLEHPDFGQLLDWCAENYDLVLIDTPSVGLSGDAVKAAQRCDGIVLVAQYNRTRSKELHLVRRSLEWADCPVLGCVLNSLDFKSMAAKRYYRTVRQMGGRDTLSHRFEDWLEDVKSLGRKPKPLPQEDSEDEGE